MDMAGHDSSPPLLEVRKLNVSDAGVQVLKDINLTVHRLRLTAVVGPDGAGKTTLLKVLAGLRRDVGSIAGEILFEGEPIHHLPAWEIVGRGLVYVPEGMRVFPEMSVLENLEVGAYCRRRDLRGGLARVLEVFPELGPRLSQPAGLLSGGQQRMVTLGRGLMAIPKLLLLDEPFMGLSPKLVNRFCNSFRSLSRSDITLLISGQHIRRVLMIAERAYILEDGAVTCSGAGPELLQDRRLQEILFFG